MTHYCLGTEFPREGFVQAAIERHFADWERSQRAYIDYIARDPESGRLWVIEAKGETSDVGLDFRTGLGQIVQGMSSPDEIYAIAVPDTPKFRYQLARLSAYMREALGLHVIRVAADGEVEVIEPSVPLNALAPLGS